MNLKPFFPAPASSPAQSRPKRVVFYGRCPRDWLPALSDGAPVWQRLPGHEVITARFTAELRKLDRAVLASSIVIGLTEPYILRRPRGSWSLAPSPTAVRTFADKARFARFATEAGLGAHVPRTFAGPADVAYPCIVKPRQGRDSRGVRIVNSAAELRQLAGWLSLGLRRMVVQELVPGQDFIMHAVCRGGRILWHTTFACDLAPGRTIKQNSTVIRRVPVANTPEELALMERFLLPLGYSGPVAIDYKRDAAGRITVIEVNPRFGGSLMRPEHVEYLAASLTTLLASAEPPR